MVDFTALDYSIWGFLLAAIGAVCLNGGQMKIDIFNHFYPKQFFEKYINVGASFKDMGK